jgi:hypothetical protein
LVKGYTVELDFEGVKLVLTPFLNTCFGKLLEQFGREVTMTHGVSFVAALHLTQTNYIFKIKNGCCEAFRSTSINSFKEGSVDANINFTFPHFNLLNEVQMVELATFKT